MYKRSVYSLLVLLITDGSVASGVPRPQIPTITTSGSSLEEAHARDSIFKDILRSPEIYENKHVRIEGTVDEVDVLGFWMYPDDDGGMRIYVRTQNPPFNSSQVIVRGIIRIVKGNASIIAKDIRER